MRRLHTIFATLLLLLLSQVLLYVPAGAAADRPGYGKAPWGASFPELEKIYPELTFEEENAFMLTTFSLKSVDPDIVECNFRLFRNRLVAVVRKYSVPLTPMMNEEFLRATLTGLGKRQKVEKRQVPTAPGMTDTVMWDYGDVLVFFQSFPPQTNGKEQPDNVIKFVYKPIYNEMKEYIRQNPDGDPNASDDDFDAVAF